MLEKFNYCSKYFIQNNPHSLFLQKSPVKDGLLPFKFPKLTHTDTEPNSWLPTSSHALLFPTSAPRGFCLIRYSTLIGCFDKTLCLVKHTVLYRPTFSFLTFCCSTEERAIFENKFSIMFFIMFLKQRTVKILIYTVEARLCYSCLQAIIGYNKEKSLKTLVFDTLKLCIKVTL